MHSTAKFLIRVGVILEIPLISEFPLIVASIRKVSKVLMTLSGWKIHPQRVVVWPTNPGHCRRLTSPPPFVFPDCRQSLGPPGTSLAIVVAPAGHQRMCRRGR